MESTRGPRTSDLNAWLSRPSARTVEEGGLNRPREPPRQVPDGESVFTLKRVSGWTPINQPAPKKSFKGQECGHSGLGDTVTDVVQGPGRQKHDADDEDNSDTIIEPVHQEKEAHGQVMSAKEGKARLRYTAADQAWFQQQLQSSPHINIRDITEQSPRFTQLYEAFIKTGSNAQRTRHNTFVWFQNKIRKPAMEAIAVDRLELVPDRYPQNVDVSDEDES